MHSLVGPDLPGGDVLIHCGDISTRGSYDQIESFVCWMDEQVAYKHRIFIAGNHDWGFYTKPGLCKKILANYPEVIYLQDSSVVIDGIKIYGSPWQPRFYDWAFNLERNGEPLAKKWNAIPEDTDILLTHGPAHGILDLNGEGINCGCEILKERLAQIKPKIHAFGHIHEAYGVSGLYGDTVSINAAMLDGGYRYTHKPVDFEITIHDKKRNAP